MHGARRLLGLAALYAGGLAAFLACGSEKAPSSTVYGGAGPGGSSSNTGGLGAAGGSAGQGGSSGSSVGGVGGVISVPTDSGQTWQDASCAATASKAKQVEVKKEIQVTMKAPQALVLMQDRSGSMITGNPQGCACSWNNSITAITGFINDPASQGLDIGLGFSPPLNNVGACDGSDCGQLVVPIGPIAQAGQAIVNSLNANPPLPFNNTPVECALRGMLDQCLKFTAQSSMREQCVAVFVSDGNATDPTPCNPDVNTLLSLVTDGKNKGVLTFAIGVIPSALGFMNQIAQAGGTNMAFDASGGPAAFQAALNAIRQTITRTETKTEIQTIPVPCEFEIPPPPDGGSLDKNKVNVEYSGGGAMNQRIGRTGSAAECGQVAGGWHYNDPANPTKIILCPDTCKTVQAITDAQVSVLLGCESTPAVPK